MRKIDEFLMYKAKNTKINYKWILNEYFREINQNPDGYYYDNSEKIMEDINNWWVNHLDEVPTTRNTKLNIVKCFLEEFDVIFPKKFWIKHRRMRKGTRPATMDRVPSLSEFKRILQHGTIKDKALFLFTSTSGMRINEVLKIKPQHINFKSNPVMVSIPGYISKTGDPRITFITDEAVEYLNEWLKYYREEYLKTAYKKTKHLCTHNKKSDELFPFTYCVAWTRWVYLIKKAGLDERDSTTKRYLLHIHCLRKYFLSQLKLKIPSVIAEALAGHEEYLDEAYRRYTKQQLGEYYLKGKEVLLVFEREPDLTSINEELSRLRKKEKEYEELQTKVEMMDKFIKEIPKMIKSEMLNMEPKPIAEEYAKKVLTSLKKH